MNVVSSAHRVPIVDAHTHIFSVEIARDRERLVLSDPWFGHLYSNPKAALATAEEIVASMDAAGVDRSVVCGFPWSDPGLCRAHNDYMAESARAFPDHISWIGTVLPGSGKEAAEAERCFEMGAVGIGELNADGQGFDLREPATLAPLVEVCVAHERPIMFHTSEPVGHIYPGKGTATPEKLVRFLEAFPDVTIVAAHWGGGLPFYELMPEVAALAHRVVYDSAASTYLYRFDVFRTVLDIVGPERVLMATDYPVLLQEPFLERVRAAGLRPEEVDPVLGGNAARVYRLPGKGAVGD